MSDDLMPKAKLSKQGWIVQCANGPLAEALAWLAGGEPLDTNGNGIALIPYTRRLDRHLVNLVDALIHLRYDANRVRLTLFEAEEVQE